MTFNDIPTLTAQGFPVKNIEPIQASAIIKSIYLFRKSEQNHIFFQGPLIMQRNENAPALTHLPLPAIT